MAMGSNIGAAYNRLSLVSTVGGPPQALDMALYLVVLSGLVAAGEPEVVHEEMIVGCPGPVEQEDSTP